MVVDWDVVGSWTGTVVGSRVWTDSLVVEGGKPSQIVLFVCTRKRAHMLHPVMYCGGENGGICMDGEA